MAADDTRREPADDPARRAAIREIISLLEDTLRRCDDAALHVEAIHIERAIHECRKRVTPPERSG